MISTLPKWIGDWMESVSGPSLSVLETNYITPAVKKIRFQGPISKMNFVIGYASVIRVSETEYRNYTVAYYNLKEGVVDIIFHIHGNGEGSQYIAGLKKGDELHVSIPRGQKQYDPKVKQHLIFGDETSLGLACSFFPVLKQNQHSFQFYFELNEENKNAPHILGLENFAVFPKNGSFTNESWIEDLPVFLAKELCTTNFILTGNVKSVQTFRKVLKSKSVTGKIYTKGYWLEGKQGL